MFRLRALTLTAALFAASAGAALAATTPTTAPNDVAKTFVLKPGDNVLNFTTDAAGNSVADTATSTVREAPRIVAPGATCSDGRANEPLSERTQAACAIVKARQRS